MRIRARFLIAAPVLVVFLGSPAPASGARAARPVCDGTWQLVASPNPGVTNYLYGMAAIDPSNVWTVGYELPQAGSYYRPLTEHWNGQAWSDVPSPTMAQGNTYLLAVAAVSSTDVWAVGSASNTNGTQQHPLIEHWDGAAWTVVPNSLPGYSGGLAALAAVAANDVWAVGSMTRIGDTRSLVLAEHWDGTKWSPSSPPNGAPFNRYGQAATALSGSKVWLAGVASDGSTDRLLTDRWNGLRWTAVPAPGVPGSSLEIVRGMGGSSATEVWIVGAYVPAPPNRVPLTARWNGSAWEQVPTPTPPSGAFITDLNDVAAPAAGDAWAVGYWWNANNTVYILHWDGTNWTEAPHPGVPYTGSALEAVSASSATDLWAAGYGEVGDESFTLIEHYCV